MFCERKKSMLKASNPLQSWKDARSFNEPVCLFIELTIHCIYAHLHLYISEKTYDKVINKLM